jgi:hypothetical protein
MAPIRLPKVRLLGAHRRNRSAIKEPRAGVPVRPVEPCQREISFPELCAIAYAAAIGKIAL